VCHLQLGDVKAAERAFDSAIGISPGYALAWLGKARALMARGRYKRAVRYIREALRIDPHFTEARLSLAEAYAASGMGDKAKEESRRAYALDPKAEEAVRQLQLIGAKVPVAPRPEPGPEVSGPSPLTTEPPQHPGPPPSEDVGGDDQEMVPSPGPSLDRWFEDHRELPPLKKDEEQERGSDP
jgi:tetratricopeptide (TPR) repeat protein